MSTIENALPITTIKTFFTRLSKNHTKNFVAEMFFAYLLLKGFVGACMDLSTLPFIKNHLKVNETTYQIYIMIAWIPWSIKAFMGSISDLYPLFGYKNKYYMVIVSVIGSTALFLLGTINFTISNRIFAPFLMFLVMLQISVVDLLCEATYAKQMNDRNCGSEAVSFVWGCVTMGSFIASTFVGVFTDYFSARYIYLICLPFAASILYPILKNFMGEIKLPKEEIKLRIKVLKENAKTFILALMMASLALGMAAANLLGSKSFVLFYALASSVVLCVLSLAWQESAKAKCNVYLFIVEATYIQIPGALDYWYTAEPSCVAQGPNFDMTYYLTYTNMVGAVASIIGIALFQAKMSKWPFRRAFLVSSLIRISSSFFDIFIVSRANVRFGIPDKLAYMFGDALILNTASMMVSMPAVVLTAKIVDSGLESTTYAVLAGFQNFGSNVSKSLGIVMMGYFNIDADSRPCNFDHLPKLIFVCHSVFPVLPVFLVHFLIADMAPEVETEEKYGLVTNAENEVALEEPDSPSLGDGEVSLTLSSEDFDDDFGKSGVKGDQK